MDNGQIDLTPWEDVEQIYSTHWVQLKGSPRLVSAEEKAKKVSEAKKDQEKARDKEDLLPEAKEEEDWDKQILAEEEKKKSKDRRRKEQCRNLGCCRRVVQRSRACNRKGKEKDGRRGDGAGKEYRTQTETRTQRLFSEPPQI